jgi:hypothetical protein
MFVGKARAYPSEGFRLERLAKDKHSSLLWKSVNYGRKSFIVQASGVNIIKIDRRNLLTFCKLHRFRVMKTNCWQLWNGPAYKKCECICALNFFGTILVTLRCRLDHFIIVNIFFNALKRSSLQKEWFKLLQKCFWYWLLTGQSH